MGMQQEAKQWMDQGYDYTESGFRSAKYQSASFFLGSDHPAAHGRSGGDFAGGFLLWGDIRDCFIRPTYVDPQTQAQRIVENAIMALSCSGLLVDVAQASPGAAAALAANAALTSIKILLKRLLRADLQLAVHFVDLIKVCTSNLSTCPAIRGLAKGAIDTPAGHRGLRTAFKAYGAEAVTDFATKYPMQADELKAMGETIARYSELSGADANNIMKALRGTSDGVKDPDETLSRIVHLHKLYSRDATWVNVNDPASTSMTPPA